MKIRLLEISYNHETFFCEKFLQVVENHSSKRPCLVHFQNYINIYVFSLENNNLKIMLYCMRRGKKKSEIPKYSKFPVCNVQMHFTTFVDFILYVRVCWNRLKGCERKTGYCILMKYCLFCRLKKVQVTYNNTF